MPSQSFTIIKYSKTFSKCFNRFGTFYQTLGNTDPAQGRYDSENDPAAELQEKLPSTCVKNV